MIIKLSLFTSALGHDDKGLEENLFGETELFFSACFSHVLTLAFQQLMFILSLSCQGAYRNLMV